MKTVNLSPEQEQWREDILRRTCSGEITPIEAEWNTAWIALVMGADQAPLARLIRGSSPVPPWIRENLGNMLDPHTNAREAYRLIFQQSPALRRKMQTDAAKFAAGLAVLDLETQGQLHKNAVADVAERLGKSKSYVEKRITEAGTLPDFYKSMTRKSATYRKALAGVARK